MKQLQWRSALEELHCWIETGQKRLDEIECGLRVTGESYRNGEEDQTSAAVAIREMDEVFVNQLERARHDLADLADEIRAKRERELSFVVDSIEIEIRQGFYDLKTSEQCTRVQFEWGALKQRLKATLDRVELAAIKVKKFNSDLNQINDWINVKQCAEELDTYTRLKPSSSERTLLLVEPVAAAAAGDPTAEGESVLAVVEGYKRDLDTLEAEWLLDSQPRSLDDETKVIVAPYMALKVPVVFSFTSSFFLD